MSNLNEALKSGCVQASLETLLTEVFARLEADRVSVMLCDGDSLRLAACLPEAPEQALRQTVSAGQGIAGTVLRDRVSIRIDDVSQPPMAVLGAQGGQGSAMCVPICNGGLFLGVISVRRLAAGSSFSPAQLRELEALALYAGKAIHAAQLEYLLNSAFAQRALTEPTAAQVVLDAAQQPPAQLARVLAKSFYREMNKAGFGAAQIIEAATEIINQLSDNLRKHGKRFKRNGDAGPHA